MEALLTTSFDRFARYSYTYRLRTELLAPSPLRILDVGDPYGTLAGVFPDDDTVSIDLFAEGSAYAPRHHHTIGSGFALPFPDGAFDLVTAHDVLEHVPATGRSDFMDELLRVSAGPVVVAAPFADVRTTACERIVNAYYLAHVGAPLQPLEEHAAEGLPDAAVITRHLADAGVDHVVYSDGWLFHWLAFMLLKAHYVSVGAAALDRATDAAFNRRLREVDRRSPHYRRAIILRPPRNTESVLGPGLTSVVAEEGASADALETLAWDLVQVLPAGSDPADPDSDLHRWMQEEIAGEDDDRRTVAMSLRTALEDARANLATITVIPEVPQDRPSVTAVVLHRQGKSAVAVAASLADMDEIAAVVVCGPSAAPSSSSTSVKLRDLRVDGDDALHLAAAVADIDTEAILVVDPSVGARPEQVRALLDSYDAAHLCVGYHRPTGATPPQAAALVVDGDEALFVARELFLIQRALYSGVGGLDGRFRGYLDDVDLGLRLRLYGYAVRTAGPATWMPPAVGDVDPDTATLWIWIKSFAASTLEQLLPQSLLAYLVDPRPRDGAEAIDFGVELESLLLARVDGAVLRAVDDDTVRARFGDLQLSGSLVPARRPVLDLIRRTFEWPSPSPARRPRVLVLADDGAVGRMSGLASGLSGVAEVTVGGVGSVTDEGRSLVVAPLDDLAKQAEHAEIVLIPARLVRNFADVLEGWSGVVAVDLEDADRAGGDDAALDRGDVFVCGSETQREFWLPQLLRRGRGVRLDDQPDELIFVVPVASNGALACNGRDERRQQTVVIDLAGLPSEVPRLAEVLELLRGTEAGSSSLVVIGDPDGRHAAILELRVPELGRATHVLARPTGRERSVALAGASVVMRPVPDTPACRFGPSTPGLDVLASGTPLVTTRSDPAAPLVEQYRAGAVVADEAALLTEETVRSVSNREASAMRRVGADRLRRDLATGAFLEGTLMPLARRPWRWRWGHSGGVVPLEASPAVAALLDEREAQVTASVTTALALEMQRQVRAAQEALGEELQAARARLAVAEDELNEVRHEAHRIRSHPLIRLALRARRALRAR